MTSSFQGGSYNRIEGSDVSGSLRQSFDQQNKGWRRAEQMLRQNQQAVQQQAGRGWEGLQELAPSVEKLLGKYKEARDTRREAEAAQYYKEHGLPDWQIEEYRKGRQKLRDESNALIKLTEEDPDMDPFTKERFINLAPWKQVAVMELHMKNTALEYSLDIPEINEALDPAQYEAAKRAHSLNFLEQFQGVNPVMLKENVLDHMNTVEEAHKKNWMQERGKAMEANRLDTVHEAGVTGATLGSKQNPGTAAVDTITTLRAIYKGNNKKARESYFDRMETAIDNDVITSLDQIDAIGEQEIDGYKIKNHPQMKGRWNKLKEKFVDDTISDVSREEKLETALANDNENKVIAALPPLPSKGHVRTIRQALERKFPGKTFPELQKIEDDLSLEGSILQAEENEAQDFYDAGLLTPTKNKEFSFLTRQKFQEKANKTGDVISKNDAWLKASSALITSKSATFPDGRAKHPTAIILAARMENFFTNQYLTNLEDGMSEGDAREHAFKATQIEASTYKKNKFGNGWNIGLPKAQTVASRTATQAAIQTERTEALSRMQLESLTVQGLYGGHDELKHDYNRIINGKSVGWIKRIKKLYPDLDEIDIYNTYAANMGKQHQQIKHPESYKITKKYVANPITKDEYKALYDNPTNNNSIKFFRLVDEEDRIKMNFYPIEQDWINESYVDFNNDKSYTGSLLQFIDNNKSLMQQFNIPSKDERKNAREHSVKRRKARHGDRSKLPDITGFPAKRFEKVSKEVKERRSTTKTRFEQVSEEVKERSLQDGQIKQALMFVHNKVQAAKQSREDKLAAGWTLGPRGILRPPAGVETMTEEEEREWSYIYAGNGGPLPTIDFYN